MTLTGDRGDHPEPSYPALGPGQEECAEAARLAAAVGPAGRLAALAVKNCPGCFAPDHPCGDPVCDLRDQIRDALASGDIDLAPAGDRATWEREVLAQLLVTASEATANEIPDFLHAASTAMLRARTVPLPAWAEREHHPDCPAPHFPERSDRCRCAFMVALDGRATDPARRHNHDPIGVYANCPACGTVIPPDPAPEGDLLAEVERRIKDCMTWPTSREGGAVPGLAIALQRVREVRAARRATDPGAGETVTEWGVRCSEGIYAAGLEFDARLDVASDKHHDTCVGPRSLVTRQRTTFPDRVTEWQPADPEEGHDHE